MQCLRGQRQPHGLRQRNRGTGTRRVEIGLSLLRRSREQIADAGENARGRQAGGCTLNSQYCRESSQWASERSVSARSPKGASALIA